MAQILKNWVAAKPPVLCLSSRQIKRGKPLLRLLFFTLNKKALPLWDS